MTVFFSRILQKLTVYRYFKKAMNVFFVNQEINQKVSER